MSLSRKRTSATMVGLAMLIAAFAGSASGSRRGNETPLPRGSEPVKINPADFSANIDNRQWPMTVGSRWVYRVTDMSNGSVQRQVITVTERTRVMADGVRARVVSDVVTDHGKPTEVTEDWYAQDRRGNVWYFGEHTTAFKHGKPTNNGNWQARIGGGVR